MSASFPEETRDIRLLSPRSWPTRHRVHAVLLAVLMAVHIGCQLVLARWYIEDAAISFAYGRNLALGEGLVGVPGGERIEGYSNPTWVALLALGVLVGIDPFYLSKILAAVFGALCIPLVWDITRQARGGPHSRLDEIPLVSAVALAVYAQFVIWNASGLENSIFCVLMALGVWSSLREVRDQSAWPWSAVLWMLLAVSRPEGIVYCAWAGLWTMCLALHREPRWGAMHTAKWLLSFWLPFGVYHWIRYQYFAWEWPNTYYGKLGHKKPRFDNWNGRGWKQARDWAFLLWQGFFLPIYLLAMTGLRGRRWLPAGIMLFALAAALLLFPGPEWLRSSAFMDVVREQEGWPLLTAPKAWPTYRMAILVGLFGLASILAAAGRNQTRWMVFGALVVWVLLAAYTVVTGDNTVRWLRRSVFLSVGIMLVLNRMVDEPRPGWRALIYCWGLAGITLWFHVYSTGDWMKGFRWFGLMSVPMAVLFGIGIGVIADAVQDTWDALVDLLLGLPRTGTLTSMGPYSAITAATLTLLVLPPNINHLQWFNRKPETGPFSVRKRVNYYTFVLRRMHVEGRVTSLDVDMGANMYWGSWDLVDIAGLIDVPIAHHNFDKPFVREYLFEEKRPHLAHVHGGWERTSRFKTHDEWDQTYIEIPGFPSGKKRLHVGNHVRRDLLMATEWPGGSPQRVELRDGITIEGFDLPSATVAPNRHLYVEVGLHTRTRTQDEGFELAVFLSRPDGYVHSWVVSPGYTWLDPHEWGYDEVFVGRYALQLPKDIAPGSYDLGFVALSDDGRVIGARSTDEGEWLVPPGVDASEPRFARGEVRWPGVVEVVDPKTHERWIRDAEKDAILLASEGDCVEAEERWRVAWAATSRRYEWRGNIRERLAPHLARCRAERARALPVEARVPDLVAAHDWDWHEPTYLSVARDTAATYISRGHAARDQEDWEAAFPWYRDAVRIDPTQSWARRWAEETRDKRLGLDKETVEAAEAERQKKAKAAREETDRRRKERAEKAGRLKGSKAP